MSSPEPIPTSAVSRRHPAQVTADRLTEHLQDLQEFLTPRDRDVFARAAATLQQIADGER